MAATCQGFGTPTPRVTEDFEKEKFFPFAKHEPELYKAWETQGMFKADVTSTKEPFVISMPPPNATGILHTGHAVMLALEDAMTRYKRMKGFEALWVPGTDHAAIATESVVIKKLQAEGMKDPRTQLGREGLLEKIREFVKESRATICAQVRLMGCSCDWDRECFTMDPKLNRCVRGVFSQMFRDGLVYRGPRIVNWDVALQTTLSDDEVEHKNRNAKFYTIKYGPFLVGTSRPETKLGDTAVAVHPLDERYKEHVGKTYEIPWPKGPTIKVRVVADEAAKMDFGSGCVGVTPAHSATDFDIAQRHDLPMLRIIEETGRMNEAAGPYAGMKVNECREAFVKDLEEAGLMEKIESYEQSVSVSYRSGATIEPLPKDQWFINVDRPGVIWKGKQVSLKQAMRDVVTSGDIRILPTHQELVYFHWIDNLRDWCISRQIWWGHRIPVYYRGEEEMYVSHREPEGEGWRQDEDTLDTWFSSGLWTWSTLVDETLSQDPNLSLNELLARSPDFQKFHPTSVMETGYDILFFWVARMILMTTYTTKQIPFSTVYLHGLVLDETGEKMSKSRPKYCIDPSVKIAEQGADVLRMALTINNAPGRNFRILNERLDHCKGLRTKLWNASKLVHLTTTKIIQANFPDGAPERIEVEEVTHPVNKWWLLRMDALVEQMDHYMDEYQLGVASELIRTVFWDEFCDYYLELIKPEPLGSMNETAVVLINSMNMFLKMFHPFVPFVTEYLWGIFGDRSTMLIQAPWPERHPEYKEKWQGALDGVQATVALITALRSMRSEQNVPQSIKVQVYITPILHEESIVSAAPAISRMVNSDGDVAFVKEGGIPEGCPVVVQAAFKAAIQPPEVDRVAEKARLEKQLKLAQKEAGRLTAQLSKPSFREKAKPAAIEKAEADLAKAEGTITGCEQRLKELAA